MLKSLLARTQRHLNTPWYPYLVALLNSLDFFIMVIPNDLLMVSAVFAQPRKWLWIAFVVSLGTMLGTTVLYMLLSWDPEFVRNLLPWVFASKGWASTEDFIGRWGFWAMLVGSSGPLPLMPFVLIGALSKMTAWKLFLSIFLGRVFKYIVFCWIASHSPKQLNRWFGWHLEI